MSSHITYSSKYVRNFSRSIILNFTNFQFTSFSFIIFDNAVMRFSDLFHSSFFLFDSAMSFFIFDNDMISDFDDFFIEDVFVFFQFEFVTSDNIRKRNRQFLNFEKRVRSKKIAAFDDDDKSIETNFAENADVFNTLTKKTDLQEHEKYRQFDNFCR